jgi:hypothetical protein
MLSIRTPATPGATLLVSVATRHFNWMFSPLLAAGRVIVVVM